MIEAITALLCNKHKTSYILFDTNFRLLDYNDAILDIVDNKESLTYGEDIRDILWIFIGLYDEIMQLYDGKKDEIHIPMIEKNGLYYDLDINTILSPENEKFFVAYFVKKSKHSIEYIHMIQEINKKTLINQTQKNDSMLTEQLISFCVDLDGTIVDVNATLSNFLRLPKEKIVGSHFCTFFQTRNTNLEDTNIIFSAKNVHGKSIFFNVTVIPLQKDGVIYRNMIICQDISYLQQAKKNLEYVADLDTVTGLPNRKTFLEEIDQYIASSKPFNVALISINEFKTINKEYGYHAGDMLLKYIATILQNMVRLEDTLCRIGGDSFGILCTRTSVKKPDIPNHIKEIDKKPFNYSKEDIIPFDLSFKTFRYPEDIQTTKEIISTIE